MNISQFTLWDIPVDAEEILTTENVHTLEIPGLTY